MSESPAQYLRQLSRLRWPLLAVAIVSLGVVSQTTWIRLTGAQAIESKPAQQSEPPHASQSAEDSTDASPLALTPNQLVIVNPPNYRCRVGLAIDGVTVWLEAGESICKSGDGPWSVAFHRGDVHGDVHESLSPGEYRFDVTDEGWRLTPIEED